MTNPNVYPHQPEFVDNRGDNTLAAALIARIEHLCATLAAPPALDIATGYFNPEGFGIIASRLEKAGHIRLLIGAEPVPPPARPERHLGDPRGARFEARVLRDALDKTRAGLLRDRDRMAFSPGTDRAIQSLLAFLTSGKIEVRRYTRRFLHGKGLDSEVLPGIETMDRSFSDDVEQIRRIRAGDATLFDLGGEDPRAHTGEEYRQELRKALADREGELRSLPWGVGSGLRRGRQRGHFFCARVDDRVLLRFVPLDSSQPIERDGARVSSQDHLRARHTARLAR